MKKTVCIALSAVCVLGAVGLTGCGSDPFAGFHDKAKEYAERAVLLNESVREKYWEQEGRFTFHYYPNYTDDASGDLSPAYVWPHTETVAANWRIATLSEGAKKQVSTYYTGTIEAFEYYRAFREDYHAYCASRAVMEGFAAGDTYYDDNIWISREFLNAYEIFGAPEYLTTSGEVAEFVWSGWANDDLGGIYWCEQKKNSRNTCSNAPASLLFARLYEATGEEVWLERAVRVYDWTYRTLRDPSDNVYWDNIGNEGNITDWKFTYNTGSMISAGVRLYEITKETKYLDQAKASARGAYNHWFKDRDGDIQITSDNPWFNVLLLESWTELYPHDKETTLPYIEAYEHNLNRAYGFLHDNLMPSNWVTGWKRDEAGNPVIEKANVLDMAANAENFGTLAYFYQYIKEN